MEQMSVNQRIRFLIEQMGLSSRAFSELIGESPTNTHNYIGKRNSMPGADYLEKVTNHFENVNPIWLVTGKGEPFIEKGETPKPRSVATKNNSGNAIGINHGKATQQQGGLPGNEAALLKEIEHLKQQLAMKDTVIAAKDETIDLLKAAYGRPN